MKNLKHILSLIIGLTGLSTSSSGAEIDALSQLQKSQLESIELFESNKELIQEIVTQDELLQALQKGELSDLLNSKGVLINKHSADSTICRGTSSASEQ